MPHDSGGWLDHKIQFFDNLNKVKFRKRFLTDDADVAKSLRGFNKIKSSRKIAVSLIVYYVNKSTFWKNISIVWENQTFDI